MSRETWIGAALVVGGLAAQAAGQDAWRAAERPPVIRAASRLVPGAALGRPVPMRQVETPGAFPSAYRGAAALPHDADEGVRTIPTVPPPGAVIATSASAVPAALPVPEAEVIVEGFASDRPARPPLKRIAGEEPKVLTGLTNAAPPPGNWKNTYPPSPPPELPPGNWKNTYPVGGTPELPAEAFEEASGPAPRLYFGAEYLLWWTKGDRAPVLVTTGAADPTVANPGALGNADTAVLQDGRLPGGTRSGGRFTAGWFVDECAGKALELSGFFLGSRSNPFSASASQFPVLSRPFFNVVGGNEEVEQVAFPGRIAGNVTVSAPSQLWGLEANLICPACCGCDWRVNWLAGPRYLNLTDDLSVTEDLQLLADVGNFRAGDRVLVRDSFRTKNEFYGGQVGAEGRLLRGRWTVDGRAKVALGVTRQELTIGGTQTFLAGVNPDPRPGGLLAVPSNSGTFRRTEFGVVPEVGVSVGYYVTESMRLSVGYNFLYWSSVVRPGQQIDRGVNPFQIPNFDTAGLVDTGEVRPLVPFKTTDYWAQGVTFGVEFNW